ncbi:MAG: 54S ribosomal protein L22, mitochondrial [Paramarteilia canceri]
MTVEEAEIQLTFQQKEYAHRLKKVVTEAADMAKKDFNVEFRGNLWIEKALVCNSGSLKGLRKTRLGMVQLRTRYSHLLIKLVEGQKPKYYYKPPPSKESLAKEYFNSLYSRKIHGGL